MNTRIKSLLILLGTLLTGALLGGVIVGLVARDRTDKLDHIRKPGGFTEHVKHVIQPTSDEQWDQVRPVVEKTASKHRGIIRGAHKNLKASFDSMLVELEPLLEAEQIERLKHEHLNMKKHKGKKRKGKKRGKRGEHPPLPPDGPPPGE